MSDLVRADEVRPAVDAFEQRFMVADHGVPYRQRRRPSWKYHATFLFIALVLVLESGSVLAGALGLSLTGFLWLFFAVLRISVDEEFVQVRFGLFGPKIPLSSIRSAEAIRYDWTKFRGSFIRHRFLSRQTLYSMPGDAGHGVSIRWEDERGRERTAIVASPDAEALVRQIQGRLQRRALPSGSPAALAERSDS